MNIEIANRLVQLRKGKGWSQEELAAQLGISRQAVSKWERAESSPDTDNLILLARLYELSLDELLQTSAPSEELREQNDNEPCDSILAESSPRQENEPEQNGTDENEDNDDETFQPIMLTGAVSLLAVLSFLLLGLGWGLWHPGWIVFLAIPLYACITKGSAEGTMSMLATILYFLLGSIWGLWHPGWIVFLLIPLGTALHAPFRSIRQSLRRRNRRKE